MHFLFFFSPYVLSPNRTACSQNMGNIPSFLSMCIGHGCICVFPLPVKEKHFFSILIHFTFLHSFLNLYVSIRMYVHMDWLGIRIVTNIPSFMRVHLGIQNICVGAAQTLFFHLAIFVVDKYFENYFQNYWGLFFFLLKFQLILNSFLLWG